MHWENILQFEDRKNGSLLCKRIGISKENWSKVLKEAKIIGMTKGFTAESAESLPNELKLR